MAALKEAPQAALGPYTQTQSPMITGTSVLACKYKDGVLMLADTLGSYGSMARFTDLQRIVPVNATTMVGASGEYSDFQYLQKLLTQLVIEDFEEDDGRQLTGQEIHSYLSRVLYNRRSKGDPLWNYLVTASVDKQDGKPFLGLSELHGSCFPDDFIATGYGAHMALPLLRKQWKSDLSYDEAKKLLEACATVLFYRDCRAINKYTLGQVTKEGVRVSKPYSLPTTWDMKAFIKAD